MEISEELARTIRAEYDTQCLELSKLEQNLLCAVDDGIDVHINTAAKIWATKKRYVRWLAEAMMHFNIEVPKVPNR